MLDKNVIQIIKSRKSIYPSQFSGKILENSIISELIDISNYAPSHKMTNHGYTEFLLQKQKTIF